MSVHCMAKKKLALDAQKSMCFAVISQIVKLKIGIHFDTKLKRTPKKKPKKETQKRSSCEYGSVRKFKLNVGKASVLHFSSQLLTYCWVCCFIRFSSYASLGWMTDICFESDNMTVSSTDFDSTRSPNEKVFSFWKLA